MFDDKYYDQNDCCKKDERCHKKPFVKVFVECGKECVCLCGKFWGIECKCGNSKVIIIKTKCGKKIFINFDKVSYWKFCDGWD